MKGLLISLIPGRAILWVTLTPVWNLEVTETRFSNSPDRYCALVLLNAENYVLNDMLIDRYGAFDLNGKNLTVGGDFINNGRFTPDGRGWDSGRPQAVDFERRCRPGILFHKSVYKYFKAVVR